MLFKKGAIDERLRGVHELVYGSIQLAETDLRRDLWGSIVLAGGTTMMTGIVLNKLLFFCFLN